MKLLNRILLLLPLLPLSIQAADPTSPIPTTPQFKIEETLISYRGMDEQDYLAFPSIVESGKNEILLSYKRGEAHLKDPGAVLEVVRLNLKSGQIIQDPIQLGIPKVIMQMGEWVRFPNGSLATYIDAQFIDDQDKHARIGLQQAISRDNGKSFGALKPVGEIEGVEYGYLFDTAIVGKRLYALIMTFEYLAGGRRSVDALYTDDNGDSWHFMKNLSQEFGDIRINESSLIAYKNGFLVTTRGYDNMQRLHRVDQEFNLIHETNLTEITPTIASYIGRPRLFIIQQDYFLIGRNRRSSEKATRMELGLVRFDPESLTVEKQFVLDNVEQGAVTDGYYPCPILVDSDERTLLNVFDYRALFGGSPDIIRMQFDSSEFLR